MNRISFFKSLWRKYYFRLVSIGTLVTAFLFSLIEITNPNTNIIIPINNEIPTKVVTVFLSLLLAYIIDKQFETRQLRKKHYPLSYPIIKDKIPEKFSEKTVLPAYKEMNNKTDVIIASPLEYVKETLQGNSIPQFNPNEYHFYEMFDDDTTHVIAITAENPNSWLDPTVHFYMSNCNAITLLRSQPKSGGKLTTKHFDTDNNYRKFYKKKTEKLIESIINKNDISKSFEFIRFIMYTSKQEEYLSSSVFPSLKSIQDLFGIKSFFLECFKNKTKIEIEANPDIDTYEDYIRKIWNKILNEKKNRTPSFEEQIKNRSDNVIPEFVLFFKKSKDIFVSTYVNGEICSTWIRKDTDTELIQGIETILSCLAHCYKEQDTQNKNWKPIADKNLNLRNSYLCWE